jgi:hypothetical protein
MPKSNVLVPLKSQLPKDTIYNPCAHVWRRSPSFIHKKAAIVVVVIIVVVIATIVIVAAALILYIGGKHMQFGIKKKCTSLNTRKK